MDRHNDDDDNDDDDNDADTTGGWIIVRSEFLIPSRTKTKEQISTDKASIDGVEGGKTLASQQCGLENQSAKIPRGACYR